MHYATLNGVLTLNFLMVDPQCIVRATVVELGKTMGFHVSVPLPESSHSALTDGLRLQVNSVMLLLLPIVLAACKL